jgi:integrase
VFSLTRKRSLVQSQYRPPGQAPNGCLGGESQEPNQEPTGYGLAMAGKRRGHGDDSIYFDQVNACWVGSVSLGYYPDGKRKRRTVRGRTKTEVRDKLKILREDITVRVQAPAGYTVRQAVDDWLETGLDGRSESTVTKYRCVLRPVVERLGRAVLHDLTAHDVRQALNLLAKEQSTATVAMAHNALTRAIRHAESRDLIRRNVSALIDTPKGQVGRPSRAMTIEQARRVIEIAGDLAKHRLGACVTLCLQTGIRTEEARALTWEHVDLNGDPDQDPPVPPSIAVWRSVRLHGDTKTRKSRRTLGLPRHTVDVLREHRERQERDWQKAGGVWKDHDLVFCTGIGTPLDAGNIRRQFRVMTEAAGIGRGWTPQELRHTFVSLLSATGTPVEEIARLAGHSSTRTTEVIYRRELRPVLTRGAEVMDAILS